MSADTGAILKFRYVDLDKRLGGATHSTSAVHVFADRVYLGFPDSGGSRPYLVVLKTTPGVPGMDVGDKDFYKAQDLDGHEMPKFASASPAMIDTMTDFGNRLYVFSGSYCVRSTSTTPRNYKSFPGDWATCTPTASRYTAKTAILLPSSHVVDVHPEHKAFPQAASYRGRLYVGRNTTSGPQLWVCNPRASGGVSDCDPADWSLLAPNTSGDTSLSQFNNSYNTHVTFVAATSGHLYVGYNNPRHGVVVMRSSKAAPTSIADFVGNKGCAASGHPAVCPGIGGNGFGSTSNTRIVDGKALTFRSQENVYLSVGTTAARLVLYRIID
jgi:hypothetical protein